MATANAVKEETPFGVKWEWDDGKKCLTYKSTVNSSEKSDKKKKSNSNSNKLRDAKIDLRTGVPKLTTQNRQKMDGASSSSSSTSRPEKKPVNSTVTIGDVMNASINMLSERYYIPVEFEGYCNNRNSRPILEDFLLHLNNYFYWYFESIDSRVDHNPVCIERNDEEKSRIEKADTMLRKLVKSLARCYCMLILGLEAEQYHHMNSGKNFASSGFKDRGLYETFYPYCTFFVWITFKRRDYEVIRQELGRLMRSDSFNSKLKVESILDEEQQANEAMIYSNNLDYLKTEVLKKYQNNKIVLNEFRQKIEGRTSSTKVLGQRSPALVSIMPTPEQKSRYLFDRRHGGLSDRLKTEDNEEEEIDRSELIHNLGIIGQPMKGFHVKTLAPRGNNEDEQAANGEKEGEKTEENANNDAGDNNGPASDQQADSSQQPVDNHDAE